MSNKLMSNVELDNLQTIVKTAIDLLLVGRALKAREILMDAVAYHPVDPVSHIREIKQ